jgi:hypothetical protein
LRNAHHIKLADKPSPWDESFEYTFRQADDSVPQIAALFSQAEAPIAVGERPWDNRLAPQWYLQGQRAQIAELIASLVVRSPGTRNSIRVGVSSYFVPEESPWGDSQAPDSLVALNQRPMLECYSKALAQRGKFALLLSDHSEFVFGDGFLNNFHSGVISPNNPRCLVPVLPTVAVCYYCPTSYTKSADFVAVRLRPDEVEEVNSYTQIYSSDYLYYRSMLPKDLSYFKLAQHQMIQYHTTPWVDHLMDVVANSWF